MEKWAPDSQHMDFKCNFLHLSWKRPDLCSINYKGHNLYDQILLPDPLGYQMTVNVSFRKSLAAPGKSSAPFAHFSFAGLIHEREPIGRAVAVLTWQLIKSERKKERVVGSTLRPHRGGRKESRKLASLCKQHSLAVSCELSA